MSSKQSVVPPFHGIIPARFGSTRFPGKPLADINGKPMLWHVFNRAVRCEILSSVTVATDDSRIAEAAARYDIPTVMTRADHESGTDRVKEAADTLGLSQDAIIVNIQGDEPLLDPRMLYDVTDLFANPEIVVGTLAHRIDWISAQNPDRVKVVFSNEREALYFSRAPIPWDREEGTASLYYGHVGIYAFRKSVLDRFVSLPPGRLEHIEKLEQLRLLENGIKIHVAITDCKNISVDRPGDLLEVIRILRQAD